MFSLWLPLSNWFHLAPVSFLFAFFSDEKGTRCHVHSWKQKWNYSHFFHAFLSPGVETTPTARLSPRHLDRHGILKVHLSKWWWSRFKTIFEQLRWSACFKSYMYASLQTHSERQKTSTANQNNSVRGEMFVMRLRVSGCWEKHYETLMSVAYMGTMFFVTTWGTITADNSSFGSGHHICLCLLEMILFGPLEHNETHYKPTWQHWFSQWWL